MGSNGRLREDKWQYFKPLRLINTPVENLDEYGPGGYHPVHIGDSFQDERFVVVHKLGHGGYSTVWLGIDFHKKNLVALKILCAAYSKQRNPFSDGSSSSNRFSTASSRSASIGQDPFESELDDGNNGCNELDILQQIARKVSEESKERLAVEVETFWINGPNGKHLALVSNVNGPCLQDYLRVHNYPPSYAQKVMLDAAKALRHLHRARIIHGDFTTRNILIELDDISSMSPKEVMELFGVLVKEKLCPKEGFDIGKEAPKWIYQEAAMSKISSKYLTNRVVVIDFGLSMIEDSTPPPHDNGSPYAYRAPEIMGCPEARLYLETARDKLGRRFSDKVDIWALACDIFEFRTHRQLFASDVGSHALYTIRDTMADIWREERGDDWRFLSDTGVHRREKRLLYRIEKYVTSEKERGLFYDLLKKMLKRKPEHRIGIEEVVEHPWFTTNFDQEDDDVREE